MSVQTGIYLVHREVRRTGGGVGREANLHVPVMFLKNFLLLSPPRLLLLLLLRAYYLSTKIADMIYNGDCHER